MERDSEPLRLLFVASEAAPFAKTGGLADVVGALPRVLAARGHAPGVIIPLYRQCRETEAGEAPRTSGRTILVPGPAGPEPVELWHARLPGSRVPIFFIRHDGYFDREELYGTPAGEYPDNPERYAFFCRAVVEVLRSLALAPQVLHLNDWQAALVPAYLKTVYRGDPDLAGIATVLTVHNLAYQGRAAPELLKRAGLPRSLFDWRALEFYGQLNLLKGGLVMADRLTTVSPTYAREILTPEFGCGLEGVLAERARDLTGIVNGADYDEWDPARDRLLPARYSPNRPGGKTKCARDLRRELGLPETDRPLAGFVGRLVEQKGLDLLAAAADRLLALPLQYVFLGSGDERYREFLRRLAARAPEQVAVRLGFDNRLAHLILAGSDLLLVPSLYEPCGLNQLHALRYGTVPVVHATGGLADTVRPVGAAGEPTGFAFGTYRPEALVVALEQALAAWRDREGWRRLRRAGMAADWSWSRSAATYEQLYRVTIAGRGRPGGGEGAK